jgi:hypothetical protein
MDRPKKQSEQTQSRGGEAHREAGMETVCRNSTARLVSIGEVEGGLQ